MLVNIYHDSPREHRRLLVAGVAFLTVIALLIALSIAIYQKTFETVTTVTIKADRAGLQLAKFGDVRLHGVLVGQVREIEPGRRAGRDHGRARARRRPTQIPEQRRRSQILPTTLFGQKFVSLRPPRRPVGEVARGRRRHPAGPGRDQRRAEPDPGRPLPAAARGAARRPQRDAQRAGDRARAAAASSSARPWTSSTPTSARSTTHLPTLREDLVTLADVADTYDLAAPDLLAVLRNVTVTGQTIIDKRAELDVFFSDLAGPRRHLDPGARRQRGQPDPGRPGHRAGAQAARGLLAGVPLPDRGRRPYAPLLAKTFEGNQVKQYIEFGTPQYRAYDERRPARRTARSATARGASGCRTRRSRSAPVALDEGSDIDATRAERRHPPHRRRRAPRPSPAARRNRVEQAIVNALLAATAASSRLVDALGSPPYGPVGRGGDGSRRRSAPLDVRPAGPRSRAGECALSCAAAATP